MGLGTLFPPEVVWERCAVHDKCILTSCLLAAAPPLREKQVLAAYFLRRFRREFTLHFPYPLPRQSSRVLLVGLGLTRVSLVCLRTGRLTVAPHPRITPDARTVEVTSFQTWFWWKNKTQRAVALSLPVLACCKQICNML